MYFGFKKMMDLPAKVPTSRTQDGKYATPANDSGIDHANMQLTFGMDTGSLPPPEPPPQWSTSASLMLDGFMLPPAAGDH
jgi:hypothetical protein